MEFSQLARPPHPLFLKLVRMTRCFDLWRLKIRGVTFNDSCFGLGKVKGSHIYEIFLFIFWMFQVKLIILRGNFFTLTKIIIFMEWPDPPPYLENSIQIKKNFKPSLRG